jgi:DNA-binding CsgD family transcriptional regulator
MDSFARQTCLLLLFSSIQSELEKEEEEIKRKENGKQNKLNKLYLMIHEKTI